MTTTPAADDPAEPLPALEQETNSLLRITTFATLVQNLYAAADGPAHDPLQQVLFDLLFELIPADRACIHLLDGGIGLRVQQWIYPNHGQAVELDPAILRAITRKKSAVTVRASSAIMAVPIVLGDDLIGIIHLEREDASRDFNEAETEIVTAVTSISALALKHARDLERMEVLEAENKQLRSALHIEHSMVGESPRMQQLYKYIGKVARGGSTVLIRGESGTGKELVARAIHQNSPRANRPFVAINCAAVTDTLLESEFFGHEKGAFTGAVNQKKGKLEVADGGTVFLDEIGELAPALQAKLLRVLQEHEFERVGGTRPIKVDVRVIAATNRDLETAIRDGQFRQDLYYRLNVVKLEVPPLRERRADIPALAAWFAREIGKARNRQVQGVSKEALDYLLSYDWPGNVRELENAIERAVVLGSSDVIESDDLPESVLETQPISVEGASGFHEAVKRTKMQLILNALEQAGGNFTEAAKILKIHPNHLHRLATNLGLRDQL